VFDQLLFLSSVFHFVLEHRFNSFTFAVHSRICYNLHPAVRLGIFRSLIVSNKRHCVWKIISYMNSCLLKTFFPVMSNEMDVCKKEGMDEKA
jgi:hypothetical protein